MAEINKKIIINTNISETRIAVMLDGKLSEIYIERHAKRSLVGRIYKAKVSRVLPGMQSAFINIGIERAAFLYGGDVLDPEFVKAEEQRRLELLQSGKEEDLDERRLMNRRPIEGLIKAGDEIFVQVVKDPLGSKGPRVSMLITIPGRYLVLMPDMNSVGISRRIESDEEREKLRQAVSAIKPSGVGVIVRTAAQGVSSELLEKDLVFLLSQWRVAKEAARSMNAPELLYQEPDIIVKITRDLYTSDVSAIVVDDARAYEQLKHFLIDAIPGSDSKLSLFEGPGLLFDEHGIEVDIAGGLCHKVWLPSGGYLIIDHTEALTSFDVNSGKFVGTVSVRETVLKTNLEAAKEVAVQLRKRNIGGIIIIDFIDMESEVDRALLNQAMLEALESDRAKTNVLSVNELGLVQMTRKRTSESLELTLTDTCPKCQGRGRVISATTTIYDMFRDIERSALKTGRRNLKVVTTKTLHDHIMNHEKQLLAELKKRLDITVDFDTIDWRDLTGGDNHYDIVE